MNFQKIRTVYQCEIRLLSPVHVGSGKKYVNNFDFFCEGKTIKVFDHKRLFALVEKLGGSRIESFAAAVEEKQLSRWLRENSININEAVVHSFSWSDHTEAKDIIRHLRNGFGLPIIPGSSLKGIFRTAIISFLAGNDSTDLLKRALTRLKRERPNIKFADSALCKEVLGQDAKTNLMRSLTVADFTFVPEDLQIQTACVTRLTSKNRMTRKGWNILIEKLNQNATSSSQVSFDDFLIAQSKGKQSFNFRAYLTLPWLLEALRERTEKHLNSEQSFLSAKNGDYVDSMKRFYENLAQDHKNLQENEAIMQFAWGCGWKGMTGELIDQSALTPEIRNILKLAPEHSSFPFPKSRRVAVTGTEAIPMGWIRLRFTSKEEFRQAQAIKLQKEKDDQNRRDEEKQRQKNEQRIWASMSEIDRFVAIIHGDDIARSQAGTQDPLAECWKRIDTVSPDDQKKLATAFREVWEPDPKKWIRKQCSKKQWEKVKKIRSILGEA